MDEQDGADPGTLGLDDPWRGNPAAEHWASEVPRARTAEETGGGFGGGVGDLGGQVRRVAGGEPGDVRGMGGGRGGAVVGADDDTLVGGIGATQAGRSGAEAWTSGFDDADEAEEWAEEDVASAERADAPEEDDGTAARNRREALYLEVQQSPAFAEVRDRYRKFVFPVAVGFVAWYLLYVVAATTAPGFMSRPVAGQMNVALVAGLAQFATTFLLTWAYSRHARVRRDQAALDLRWTLATRAEQERVR